jgi:hypothetical protein
VPIAWPEPIGSWKTRMPPMIVTRVAATEGERDDLDAVRAEA